ncbi:hypothetical protein ABIB42_000838 [Massilia sp. UYP32]
MSCFVGRLAKAAAMDDGHEGVQAVEVGLGH